MAKRPELVVISGAVSGRRISVPDAGLRVGRASTNDLSIPDEELSRNHCLIECDGDAGLRIMDLASANGTVVNGEELGSDPYSLKVGDVIELGASRMKVVGQSVDLGLNKTQETLTQAPEKVEKKPHSLWFVVAGLCVVATAVLLLLPTTPSEISTTSLSAEATQPVLKALSYEKVEANASHIFRYYLTVEKDVLRVVYDDIPIDERHFDKHKTLEKEARERLVKIFDEDGWDRLDKAYTGLSTSDENALISYHIRLDFGDFTREVLVENSMEPSAFQVVRKALEDFSVEELNIRAIQYSREQLLEFSAENRRIADSKWEDRDAANGNLSEAIAAYKKAISDLETLNPKPAYYVALCERHAQAEAELDRRYKEHRFIVERSIKIEDWNTAIRELKLLCELIPDKLDTRHKDASAELYRAQEHLKSGRAK